MKMEIVLIRTYYPEGTNGSLYINGKLQCYCIELPWLNNEPRKSCIPEGRYLLKKRYSPKFKNHFLVEGVPGRSFILIHPANNALKELLGCIAPVSVLTGPGKGLISRKALEELKKAIQPFMDREPIYLSTQSKNNDNH